MQNDRLLIYANHGFTLYQQHFVDIEHVLHTGDVLLI
jgi:hypothetical protein